MTTQDHSPIIGEETLRECPVPWCVNSRPWIAKHGSCFYVRCNECQTESPIFHIRAEAVECWNTRSPDVVTVMLDDSGIQAAEEAYDNFVREAGYRSPYLNTRAFRLAFEAALLKVAIP